MQWQVPAIRFIAFVVAQNLEVRDLVADCQSCCTPLTLSLSFKMQAVLKRRSILPLPLTGLILDGTVYLFCLTLMLAFSCTLVLDWVSASPTLNQHTWNLPLVWAVELDLV